MHTPILAALDNEWTVLARDRAAHRQFLSWKEEDPALASVEDIAGLLAIANNRADLESSDAVLASLARRAPTDTLAAQVLLHALLPGLKRLIRTCWRRRGADDFASEVVTIAFERIRCYPFERRPRRIAANVLRDVRQRVLRQLAREQRLADRLGKTVPFDEERIGSANESTATEELIDLVSEAVRTGRMTRRGGRLILLYRVLGVTTPTLAAAEGRHPLAVERGRQRAEAGLAAVAVDVAEVA